MKYEEKKAVLKNGQEIILRSPEKKDAAELLRYTVQRAEETDFMLKDPDECGTVEKMEEEILHDLESPWVLSILCILDGKIVGCAQYHRLSLRKIRHRADVSIGTLQEYWGYGIGTLLMKELIKSAAEAGITQLELSVFEGNDRAQHLYEKLGFEVVSCRANCVHWKDGSRLAAIGMHLLLEN